MGCGCGVKVSGVGAGTTLGSGVGAGCGGTAKGSGPIGVGAIGFCGSILVSPKYDYAYPHIVHQLTTEPYANPQ